MEVQVDLHTKRACMSLARENTCARKHVSDMLPCTCFFLLHKFLEHVQNQGTLLCLMKNLHINNEHHCDSLM